ncbi:MAG TPA: NmrA/HSCARG family protein [Scandinavium sp.]|jgi:uncharacterized protein YbjT (DUF2867 family)
MTLFGALSKQGRSVARTLLESGRYRVRALTRDRHSPLAKALALLGAEVKEVSPELNQRQHLVDLFSDSWGVFLMTPGFVPDASRAETHEQTLGKQLADAAVEAGVKHIVFSSLENVEKITDGALWAPHFTDKGKIEAYIRTLPVSSTFIQMAFFYTNVLEYYPPQSTADCLAFPLYLPEDFRAPFVDPLTATGPAVLEIIDNPEKYSGMTLPVIGEFISPRELVETFSRVTGRKAVYRSAYGREALLQYFPAFAAQGAVVDEITGMAEYAVKYGYFAEGRDVEWSRKMNPGSLTWEAFLKNSNWRGESLSFSR